MIWLILAILFGFGFVQLFNWSQRRGEYAPVVVSMNYLTLSIAVGTYLVSQNEFVFSPAILKVGIISGVFFVSSMLVMTYALTIANAAPVITSFRLSLLLPVALGVYIWSEPINSTQIAGITLAVAALALMTRTPPQTHHLRGVKSFALLIAIFLIQGITFTCMRWIHYAGLDPQRLNVLCTIGFTAGIVGWSFVLLQKKRPTKNEILMGAGIGLYNATALSIVFTALSILPGTIYFPTVGCSIVLLDNLFAHFFWKEKLSRPAIIGVGLAMVAIVLVM